MPCSILRQDTHNNAASHIKPTGSHRMAAHAVEVRQLCFSCRSQQVHNNTIQINTITPEQMTLPGALHCWRAVSFGSSNVPLPILSHMLLPLRGPRAPTAHVPAHVTRHSKKQSKQREQPAQLKHTTQGGHPAHASPHSMRLASDETVHRPSESLLALVGLRKVSGLLQIRWLDDHRTSQLV
mmetsp:Transcript_11250/g.19710  ORF Transcript_11250/g.19710 Transcript_11250/m.19710 type:complete len:182 (+) Transcript_11250:335-880(+)